MVMKCKVSLNLVYIHLWKARNVQYKRKKNKLFAFLPLLKIKEKVSAVTWRAIPCCSSAVTSLLPQTSHMRPSANIGINAQKICNPDMVCKLLQLCHRSSLAQGIAQRAVSLHSAQTMRATLFWYTLPISPSYFLHNTHYLAHKERRPICLTWPIQK